MGYERFFRPRNVGNSRRRKWSLFVMKKLEMKVTSKEKTRESLE